MRHPLVVATHNRGKLAELRALLADMPIDVLSVSEVQRTPVEIIEDGATFRDNALKKARTVASATMLLTLADDSGLEVDALDGAPGVRSARFAHERATDAENNAALLHALEAVVPSSEQAAPASARFRCVLALVDPYDSGDPHVVEGTLEGSITRAARGAFGFGYDPLFVVLGTDKTLAELSGAEKNRISHRAAAFSRLRLVLERVIAAREESARRILGST